MLNKYCRVCFYYSKDADRARFHGSGTSKNCKQRRHVLDTSQRPLLANAQRFVRGFTSIDDWPPKGEIDNAHEINAQLEIDVKDYRDNMRQEKLLARIEAAKKERAENRRLQQERVRWLNQKPSS